jgi:DNA polymerase-3 subunit delta'
MWDEVVGHEQNKEFLKSLLVGERFTPSLLFYGPAGIGKKMLAKAFAQSFLCLGDPLVQDECASCKAMKAGTHPDFIQVAQLAPEKELLMEQIKAMARQAAYAPTMSTHKVCIIDGADYMKAPAANSLLKLLEEPPPYWLFILIATDINKLLPTILSRVIQRQFKGLTVSEVSSILAAQEIDNPKIVASLADGSPGKALAYAEADAVEWRQRAFSLLENIGTDSIMEFLGELDWLEKITTQEGLLFIEMLTLLLRDGLMVKDSVKCAYYNEDILLKIKACFASWPSLHLEKALAWAGESYRGVAAYSGAKGVIEALAIKLNMMRREN